MRLKVHGAVLALMVLGARDARAQCSDGSAPPCARARIASAAATRRDPPLDDKTWIVVPFNNVTRAPDVDYLRDASVNLLYLDMSRWTDIRVVDDTRVADLMREVPGADRQPLSFDVAMAVAKRAGAGRLVMGTIIKQGAKTTIAARVFDVRRGTAIRSPQVELIVQDSLMSVFGKLAGSILDVAPPRGTELAGAGTNRVDAYQSYLAGNSALKHNDLSGARRHLNDALRLDSNFALAHYKMAILVGWQNPNDRAKVTHAASAVRFGASLPPHERALMKGLNEFELGRHHDSCQTYGALVKQDSSDIEAWYGLGECSYHDGGALPMASDTTRFEFRGTLNTAIRAFERVLELDPNYHLAYVHITDVLTVGTRNGIDYRICPTGIPETQALQQRCLIMAAMIRSGDSLINVGVRSGDTAALRRQFEEYERTESRRRNFEIARDKAREWVDAAPNESRAHIRYAGTLWFTGALADAEKQLDMAKGDMTESDMAAYFPARFELAVKLGKSEKARKFVDSLVAAQGNNTGLRALLLATGRAVSYDSTLRAAFARAPEAQRPAPATADYILATIRAHMTGGSAWTDSVERTFVNYATSIPGYLSNGASLLGTYAFIPRRARAWPPMEALPGNLRSAAIVALSKGDTAELRRSVRGLDRAWRARPAVAADTGAAVVLSEMYLALRDSVAALTTVRRALDTTYYGMTMTRATLPPSGESLMVVWPRMALLRADLEAAAGNKAVARTWYQRFVDLWAAADPEFQPIVERARKSLAALGTS